jgi:hypothetical protein
MFVVRKHLILFGTFCLFTVASSPPVFASSSFPIQCEAVGKAFGPQNPQSSIHNCYLHVMEQARSNRKLFASSRDDKVKIFGYQNLIYILRDKKVSLISGNMANLNNIEAVALSEDSATIAVLDGFKDDKGYWRKQILFFESSLNGNVVPLSTNTENVVSYAKTISFADNDQLVMNVRYPAYSGKPERSDIIMFNKKEDSRSALVKNKPENKVILSSSTDTQIKNPISVVAKGNQILVLEDQEVHIYKLEKESFKLSSTVKTPQRRSPANVNHFTLNSSKKVINVFDTSGNSQEIAY